MVDSSGLENRYSSEQKTIEGSNPSLSLLLVEKISFLIRLAWTVIFHKNGSARWDSRARPE